MPTRASPAPAAADWRSPRAVSSRSASGLESWGTASPCRRSHSCCATARSLAAAASVNAPQAARTADGGIAMEPAIRLPAPVSAIVDTPEEAAALDLPPLLVRRPLEAHLDAHGLGSGAIEGEPRGGGHSHGTYLLG